MSEIVDIDDLVTDCEWDIPNRTCVTCPEKLKTECQKYLQDLEEQDKAYMEDKYKKVIQVDFHPDGRVVKIYDDGTSSMKQHEVNKETVEDRLNKFKENKKLEE